MGGTRWPAAHDKAGDIKKTLRVLITYIEAQIEHVGSTENMRHVAPPSESSLASATVWMDRVNQAVRTAHNVLQTNEVPRFGEVLFACLLRSYA